MQKSHKCMTNKRLVDIFVDWLYSQKLPAYRTDWLEKFKCDKANAPWTQWWTCYFILRIKVCVFGDRFMVREFQRVAQNDFIDHTIKSRIHFRYPVVIYAFENLPSDNPILQFMVDNHCRWFRSDLDTEGNERLQRRDELPPSFLMRVMMRYSDIVNGTDNKTVACDYHEHKTDEEREACKSKRESSIRSDGKKKIAAIED